jgi:hypothetical protein
MLSQRTGRCAVPDHYIRVNAQTEGLHHWAGAPVGEGYLRQPHRHLFTFEVRMQVRHSDREIEVNALARWLQHDVLPGLGTMARPGLPPDFGAQSCEQLAERVTSALRARHGTRRWIECEVLEDGILGGGVRSPAC